MYDGGASARPAPAHAAAAPDGGSAKVALTSGDPCARDADCVLEQEGCCPCSSGGRRVPVAKARAKAFHAKVQAECKRSPTACVMALSNDPSCFGAPACVDGKCGVKAPATK
jgi:hypothetical protein